MIIRPDSPKDYLQIGLVISAAFARAQHSSGTEAKIVEGLRDAGALPLSLVAVVRGIIVGHVAFSPVTIGETSAGWYGLGPVAVRPNWQGVGIGAALIQFGLQALRDRAARGCVVLGNPAYYSRFGFTHDPEIHYPGVPADYFQVLSLIGDKPSGMAQYHTAFDV